MSAEPAKPMTLNEILAIEAVKMGHNQRPKITVDPKTDPQGYIKAVFADQETPEPRATVPVQVRHYGGDTAYGLAALDEEVDRVARAVEGSRNDTLFKSTANLCELVNGGELHEEIVVNGLRDAARAAGLDDAEIRQTMQSARTRTAGKARTAPERISDQALPVGVTVDPSTDEVNDERPAGDDVTARYPVLDWHEVWNTASDEPEWLCEPLLEAGRVVALFSPAKTGKSLLTLEVAAAIATGRAVLGNPARPPRSVLYVDLENSRDDLRERLQDLGYGPDDLANLHYLSFPSLPVLDSAIGGAHLLAVARQHDAALIVLDTVSRIIGGEEDSADTFRALYRHAIMPLKAEGRAVMRLDHSGKDLSRGQRGSSGKADDVDAVWSLSRRNPTTFDLRRTHSRTNHGADHLTLTRLTDPLRHELPGVFGAPSEADEVARQLDALGVPRDAGRPACGEALRASGIKVRTVVLEQAVRQRKELPPTPGAVASATTSHTAPTTAPDAAPHAWGQSGGSGGSGSQGLADELPPPPSPGRGQGAGRSPGLWDAA